MQFKKEVQDLFREAGWYPGRDVKEKFNNIHRIEEFPDFVKEFLYEYGDLEVKTYKESDEDAEGTLNFKALCLGYFKIDNYLNSFAGYGEGIKTFPIAYYDLDNAALECDAEGKIYMSSDFPNLMSENFIEGIEKVIMEDYTNTVFWDESENKWTTNEEEFGIE